MSETIMFKQPTEFLGRNGQAKMAGLLIDRLDNDVTLAPITSRHRVGRAYMLVPREMAAEVARALERVCGAAQAEGTGQTASGSLNGHSSRRDAMSKPCCIKMCSRRA